MSGILNFASRPVTTVLPDANVRDAVDLMIEGKVGAVVVVEGERPVGIFTERDLMSKVVHERRDPDRTRVDDVMSSPVETFDVEAAKETAIATMRRRHFRHLPIVDRDGRLVAMVSMRHLLQEEVEELQHEVEALEAYTGFDGHGG